jgi:hypothetical protein
VDHHDSGVYIHRDIKHKFNLICCFDFVLFFEFLDDVCKEVECGKGTCKLSKNSTFPFECECDQGWKKAFDSNDDGGMKFLPCIIPNCKNSLFLGS